MDFPRSAGKGVRVDTPVDTPLDTPGVSLCTRVVSADIRSANAPVKALI